MGHFRSVFSPRGMHFRLFGHDQAFCHTPFSLRLNHRLMRHNSLSNHSQQTSFHGCSRRGHNLSRDRT